MKITGADELARKLAKLARIAGPRMDRALAANARDVEQAAKVLIPRASGAAAAAIHSKQVMDGHEIDFGPLSKVLEGGRKAGVAKSGKKYGASRAQPFVNPALSATLKRRKARVRRAASAAVKEAMGGG